jgi:hypothetical protein
VTAVVEGMEGGGRCGLRPGAVLEFRFPGLPRTLHAVRRGKRRAPGMVAHLPEGYCRSRRFPVLVYIEGGCGEPADRACLEKPLRIAAGLGYVTVALPLFKSGLDPREIHKGLLIGAYDDYPLMARCYRVMLRKLEAAVPNLDFPRSAFGGFSNGAHATALLLSAVDPFILARFRDFYLVEGGLRLSSLHKAALARKRFLVMVGARPGDAGHRAFLESARLLRLSARRLGRDLALRRMPGVGHAFPDGAVPLLRAWLRAGARRERRMRES